MPYLVGKPNRGSGRRILAIGAHPDDIEIGCGGTLLKHQERGDEIYTLTLTHGEKAGAPGERKAESEAAATLLRSRLYRGDLRDTAVSSGHETIKIIEDVVREVRPDVVYTHTEHDWHQDHRAVHAATIVACRNVPNLLCYQSPSSSPNFLPNVYVAIDKYLKGKLALLDCFATQQACPYLEDDMVRSTARYWGRFAGYCSAEALEGIRLTSYQMTGAEERVPESARVLSLRGREMQVLPLSKRTVG